MALAPFSPRILLYDGPEAQPLAPEERYAAVSSLLERGYSVTYGVDATDPNAEAETLVVFGKFGGNSAAEFSGRARELSGRDAAGLAEIVESARAEAQQPARADWKPWFPVIDYDRCTNCMQCLSFCLFGVYGVDGDRRIQVQNQDQCKTNCPACSRVCPEAAIMFPKYKAGPINGDVVSQSDLQREKMKIDISALLGGDVYEMLRTRSERAKSRFSKERDSDKALAERQRCLVKLAQAGDIPPEVLMSLPSPEEIQRRAAEAAAKAEAARQGSPQL